MSRDQLGQQGGITTAVDHFCVRVLGDPSRTLDFDGADVGEVKSTG